MWKMIWILLIGLMLVGCEDALTHGYYKCQDCGAVYKAVGGLPGQLNLKECRSCGGKLRKVPKEESGWNEERYKERGNEVPY